MYFASHVRTWLVARLYSGIAVSVKTFAIGHMYIYTLLLRLTDNMTSQNIDLSSRGTLDKAILSSIALLRRNRYAV
jgi:hypothetical protein